MSEIMALPIEKQDRQTAKREGLFLFQISIDGRHLRQGFGKSESSGACSRQMADRLQRLIRDWTDAPIESSRFKVADIAQVIPPCEKCDHLSCAMQRAPKRKAKKTR